MNLDGALMTVLPLDLLPFVPEQTVAHYAAHVIYAVCQLPLLTLAIMLVRRQRDRKRLLT